MVIRYVFAVFEFFKPAHVNFDDHLHSFPVTVINLLVGHCGQTLSKMNAGLFTKIRTQ